MWLNFDIIKSQTDYVPGVRSIERTDDGIVITIMEDSSHIRQAVCGVFQNYLGREPIFFIVKRPVLPDVPDASAPFDEMIQGLPDHVGPENSKSSEGSLTETGRSDDTVVAA